MHLWEVTWVCLSTDIPHCTIVIYKFGKRKLLINTQNIQIIKQN